MYLVYIYILFFSLLETYINRDIPHWKSVLSIDGDEASAEIQRIETEAEEASKWECLVDLTSLNFSNKTT